MKQLLLDECRKLSRTGGHISSDLAAEEVVKTGIVAEHENIIIEVLCNFHNNKEYYEYWLRYAKNTEIKFDGMTSHEIEKCCGLSNEQIHKRMAGLRDVRKKVKGDVVRKCTITQRMMIEWVIL